MPRANSLRAEDGKFVGPDSDDYDTGDITYEYVCVCIACGERVYAKWTDHQAALWGMSGKLRCGKCRSGVLVQRDDIGAISSLTAEKPSGRAWRRIATLGSTYDR